MFLQVRWVLLAHSSRRTLQGKGLQEHDEHMDMITSASHLDLLLAPQNPGSGSDNGFAADSFDSWTETHSPWPASA